MKDLQYYRPFTSKRTQASGNFPSLLSLLKKSSSRKKRFSGLSDIERLELVFLAPDVGDIAINDNIAGVGDFILHFLVV